MQPKRGELVPIGEVVADLDGPVKAIRNATPQSLHHFTLADQVDRLVAASEADPDLGFMARLLALCSLPRTNPGKRKEYKRVNGPFTLYMVAGGGNKLPYGNPQTRLRNQMGRLFGCTVSLIYEDENGRVTVNSLIADSTAFWWNPQRPDQPSLWESKIELSEKFFNEIIRRPVPIDMNTLTALKRCSLGLDLYLWLVYRTFGLRAPLRLTWRHLYRQFGVDLSKASDKETIKFFRRRTLRELKKIKMAWKDLNYSTAPGVLILLPSTPVIPPAPAAMSLVE